MAHFKESLFISAPVQTVDRIVKDAHEWPKFWVGMSDPDKIEGDGGPGSRIEFSLVMMGAHLHQIDKTMEERHNPDGSTAWRWEFEGTAPGWLTCHHEPKDGGTQITTEFDYSLPGSIIGKLADRLLVEGRERRDFVHSLENLKALAESAASA